MKEVYYFVDDPLTFYTIDANLHYGFADFSSGFAYGIGGLQIAIAGVEGFDLRVRNNPSDSDVGLNIGAGAEFKAPFGGVPVEVKYVIGNADQLILSGGLRFTMN